MKDSLKFFTLLITLTLGVFYVMLYGEKQEQAKWDAFSTAHHCRITGTVSESTSTGFTSSGHLAVITEPAKDTYTCDGGYTVTRDAQ